MQKDYTSPKSSYFAKKRKYCHKLYCHTSKHLLLFFKLSELETVKFVKYVPIGATKKVRAHSCYKCSIHVNTISIIPGIGTFHMRNNYMPNVHDWHLQYIPRNMHTGFCFAVLCCGYTLIFPYPSGLLHWHCDNLTIAPVPAKQTWWIWINNSCEFIMNDCITTTKQSTTKPCAYFLGYNVPTASV